MNHCSRIPLLLAVVVCNSTLLFENRRLLAAEPTKLSFATDIRPILSDRCYICHGPDTEQRASELRLDDPASALEMAIKPGRPDESELIARIFSMDADASMPPPDSKLSLNSTEKNLLRLWIEQGAEFESHWAFVAPRKPEVPSVIEATWPKNDIDRFVLRRLEANNLPTSPEADRATLIRRLTFDLTGLPPTIAEMDAFLSDMSPEAYERVVDRLLSSQRFGERMAVDWLDVARYADTHGYQSDRYRAMWPWRDWVIKSFNENLPYNQFITWQLAGDLLPNATQDQILATAFNRNHRQTNEGGSVEEEFRAEYVADRVNTFGAAFLGLTLECCRCHDHKYDPITQQDYYALSAFFNSIDESGLYSHFTPDTPTPTLALSNADQASKLAEFEAAIRTLEDELKNLQPNDEQFQTWRSKLTDVRPTPASVGETPSVALRELLDSSLKAGLIGDYAFDELPDGKPINRVSAAPDGKSSEGPELISAKVGKGLKLSGENNVSVPAGGGFTRDQPFTISLWLKPATNFERSVIFHRSRAWTDAASHGYELLIEQGRLSAALIHFWPGNAIRVMSRDPLPVHTWSHVAMTYDGSSQAAGLKLFVDGDEIEVEIIRDKLTRQIHVGEAAELTIGQRFRDVGFKDGEVDELKAYDRELTPLEVKFMQLQDASPANIAEYLHNVSDDLLQKYCAEQLLSEQRTALRQSIQQTRETRSQLADSITEIMVMREDPQPRPTHLLIRGAYDAPGALVERATPAAISPVPPAEVTPLDRSDLAEWLVDPTHPLTARVAVNRFWQAIMGRGIVSTSEDFGLQGANPTHPELLDWLACSFIESDWNTKQLLKQIVMSATYRQQSNPTPELLKRDPENQLLARGPATRLSAEMIRDSALLASGLLVDRLGGAPVKPYQPEGLWEEKSGEAYTRDTGEGSRRRSLYTFWKRTSPPPAMMTFDASNREVCVVNRQTTMTPLQVLVLLNDPQLVETAVALAKRAMRAAETTPERLQFIFRNLCSRTASERELILLEQIFEEQSAPFKVDAEAAKKLVTVGDQVPAEALDTTVLAALAIVAEGLQSYDEFVMKR
jgi:hypothetical protein